ncbi:MAG: hypothetical protein VXW87_04265 [Pseudomonadota bacterium]|nr:hypothetical protein [Pseudomonadota bacterium]
MKKKKSLLSKFRDLFRGKKPSTKKPPSSSGVELNEASNLVGAPGQSEPQVMETNIDVASSRASSDNQSASQGALDDVDASISVTGSTTSGGDPVVGQAINLDLGEESSQGPTRPEDSDYQLMSVSGSGNHCLYAAVAAQLILWLRDNCSTVGEPQKEIIYQSLVGYLGDDEDHSPRQQVLAAITNMRMSDASLILGVALHQYCNPEVKDRGNATIGEDIDHLSGILAKLQISDAIGVDWQKGEDRQSAAVAVYQSSDGDSAARLNELTSLNQDKDIFSVKTPNGVSLVDFIQTPSQEGKLVVICKGSDHLESGHYFLPVHRNMLRGLDCDNAGVTSGEHMDVRLRAPEITDLGGGSRNDPSFDWYSEQVKFNLKQKIVGNSFGGLLYPPEGSGLSSALDSAREVDTESVASSEASTVSSTSSESTGSSSVSAGASSVSAGASSGSAGASSGSATTVPVAPNSASSKTKEVLTDKLNGLGIFLAVLFSILTGGIYAIVCLVMKKWYLPESCFKKETVTIPVVTGVPEGKSRIISSDTLEKGAGPEPTAPSLFSSQSSGLFTSSSSESDGSEMSEDHADTLSVPVDQQLEPGLADTESPVEVGAEMPLVEDGSSLSSFSVTDEEADITVSHPVTNEEFREVVGTRLDEQYLNEILQEREGGAFISLIQRDRELTRILSGEGEEIPPQIYLAALNVAVVQLSKNDVDAEYKGRIIDAIKYGFNNPKYPLSVSHTMVSLVILGLPDEQQTDGITPNIDDLSRSIKTVSLHQDKIKQHCPNGTAARRAFSILCGNRSLKSFSLHLYKTIGGEPLKGNRLVEYLKSVKEGVASGNDEGFPQKAFYLSQEGESIANIEDLTTSQFCKMVEIAEVLLEHDQIDEGDGLSILVEKVLAKLPNQQFNNDQMDRWLTENRAELSMPRGGGRVGN